MGATGRHLLEHPKAQNAGAIAATTPLRRHSCCFSRFARGQQSTKNIENSPSVWSNIFQSLWIVHSTSNSLQKSEVSVYNYIFPGYGLRAHNFRKRNTINIWHRRTSQVVLYVVCCYIVFSRNQHHTPFNIPLDWLIGLVFRHMYDSPPFPKRRV